MPELPEVETTRRGLAPHILGRRIAEVIVRDTRLRQPVPAGFAQALRGRRVVDAQRRAKYLVLQLDNGDRVLAHLGMSGRLLVVEPGLAPRAHDHIDLLMEADDGARALIRYHDPRRFGAMLLWPAGEAGHPLLDHLGPEPFSEAFSGEYLYALSRGRKAAVKVFLMDGRVVVGAGNIYASESLHRAGIRPSRAAGSVTRPAYLRLAAAVREVLAEAIEQGGTTLRDYAGADGQAGYFAQDLRVYGREGEPCRACATPIRQAVLGQRATYWCPSCQR